MRSLGAAQRPELQIQALSKVLLGPNCKALQLRAQEGSRLQAHFPAGKTEAAGGRAGGLEPVWRQRGAVPVTSQPPTWSGTELPRRSCLDPPDWVRCTPQFLFHRLLFCLRGPHWTHVDRERLHATLWLTAWPGTEQEGRESCHVLLKGCNGSLLPSSKIPLLDLPCKTLANSAEPVSRLQNTRLPAGPLHNPGCTPRTCPASLAPPTASLADPSQSLSLSPGAASFGKPSSRSSPCAWPFPGGLCSTPSRALLPTASDPQGSSRVQRGEVGTGIGGLRCPLHTARADPHLPRWL
ncbi:uncharacterized protein LOC125620497 [Marmota marmota marmota]|uniref:uncharacterized protein LOC125620497 n=1 Tax=Marmota marmota marmota TaxID=9994 RepID=UPI0020926A08|nr:uncharacterized protein LOC125620497 [Marmota marmota marmota]